MPRLVLVSAPAGFGKTTLLTQWLAPFPPDEGAGPPAPARRVAWVSLGNDDAEPRAFLTHLVCAVQVAAPGVGAEALALLDGPRSLAVEDVVASLLDDLDCLGGETVLALDDVHVVDVPEVHAAVAFLLDHLPPRVTLAMTTRTRRLLRPAHSRIAMVGGVAVGVAQVGVDPGDVEPDDRSRYCAPQ